MAERRRVKAEELARIVGRHFRLLEELHPDKRFTLSGLALRSRKDEGNLSRTVTRLEKAGVVETERVRRGRGKAYRYIKLAEGIATIITSIQSAARPKPGFNPSGVDLCLDVIEDRELDEETRRLYAQSLHDMFTSTPGRALREHERLRRFLEDAAGDPPADEGAGEWVRAMLSDSIPRLIRDEWARGWVLEHVYPKAIEILDEARPESVVTWAVSVLENIGKLSSDPGLREEVGKKLEEKYFNEALKPEGKTPEQLRTSILEIFCPNPGSTRGFVNRLRAQAKEREKTKLLLKEVVKRGYLTRQTEP